MRLMNSENSETPEGRDRNRHVGEEITNTPPSATGSTTPTAQNGTTAHGLRALRLNTAPHMDVEDIATLWFCSQPFPAALCHNGLFPFRRLTACRPRQDARVRAIVRGTTEASCVCLQASRIM